MNPTDQPLWGSLFWQYSTHYTMPHQRPLWEGLAVSGKWIIAAPILVAASWPCEPVSATTFLSGNLLYEFCSEAGSGFAPGLCAGFILGVADVVSDGSWPSHLRVCIPDSVLAEQVRDVAIAELRAHPENRHLSAYLHVSLALRRQWPCP